MPLDQGRATPLPKPEKRRTLVYRRASSQIQHGVQISIPSGEGETRLVPALSRANCYLVADTDMPEYAEGDLISVLMK